jgi:hypothetical protein
MFWFVPYISDPVWNFTYVYAPCGPLIGESINLLSRLVHSLLYVIDFYFIISQLR